MDNPRVFVTRLIPDAGLDDIRTACQADVWAEELPPPQEILRERVSGVDGLVSLLTDRIDAAVMDAAGSSLKVISNYAVGYDNIDVPEATPARDSCRKHTWRSDRCHCRLCFCAIDGCSAARF